MGKWKALRGKYPVYKTEDEVAYQGEIDQRKQQILGRASNPHEANPARLGRLYVEARKDKAEISKREREVNITLNALTQLLFECLEGQELEKVALASGVSISLKDEPIPYQSDRLAVVDWALASNQKANLSVQYQTLASIVRGCLENGQDIPPGVAVYMKQGLHVTGIGAAINGDSKEEKDASDTRIRRK